MQLGDSNPGTMTLKPSPSDVWGGREEGEGRFPAASDWAPPERLSSEPQTRLPSRSSWLGTDLLFSRGSRQKLVPGGSPRRSPLRMYPSRPQLSPNIRGRGERGKVPRLLRTLAPLARRAGCLLPLGSLHAAEAACSLVGDPLLPPGLPLIRASSLRPLSSPRTSSPCADEDASGTERDQRVSRSTELRIRAWTGIQRPEA